MSKLCSKSKDLGPQTGATVFDDKRELLDKGRLSVTLTNTPKSVIILVYVKASLQVSSSQKALIYVLSTIILPFQTNRRNKLKRKFVKQ